MFSKHKLPFEMSGFAYDPQGKMGPGPSAWPADSRCEGGVSASSRKGALRMAKNSFYGQRR